jgi:hypothetical protein
MTPIQKLLVLLGNPDSDHVPLLEIMYADAEADMLAWTNRQVIPAGLESAVRQVVIQRYNKQGIEGQSSHSEGGVSRAFESLPADLQQTISQYRLLKVVGRHAASGTR